MIKDDLFQHLKSLGYEEVNRPKILTAAWFKRTFNSPKCLRVGPRIYLQLDQNDLTLKVYYVFFNHGVWRRVFDVYDLHSGKPIATKVPAQGSSSSLYDTQYFEASPKIDSHIIEFLKPVSVSYIQSLKGEVK